MYCYGVMSFYVCDGLQEVEKIQGKLGDSPMEKVTYHIMYLPNVM